MIPFEIEKLDVQHVLMKSCTTALGGSISVVDTESKSEKETYKKIHVPLAVVRKFIIDNEKQSRYMIPVLVAVAFYDGHAVALERHPYGKKGQEKFESLSGEEVEWFSDMESNIDAYITPITRTGDWYIDGSFLYTYSESDLHRTEALSQDGRFRAMPVRAFKLGDLRNRVEMKNPQERSCLVYKSKTGEISVSPPIWKQLTDIGETKLGLTEDEDEGGMTSDALGLLSGAYQFDRINESLAVNLSFGLRAAKELADVFGYDSIEPLCLDDMMIELKTVNLPRVANEVKQTFDIGMPFTHAVAWLLGLSKRVNTLDSYMVLRSLLKYLTTKGIYRKNAFTPDAVYRGDMTPEDVPFLTMQEAVDAMVERYKKNFSTYKHLHDENGEVDHMYQ